MLNYQRVILGIMGSGLIWDDLLDDRCAGMIYGQNWQAQFATVVSAPESASPWLVSHNGRRSATAQSTLHIASMKNNLSYT